MNCRMKLFKLMFHLLLNSPFHHILNQHLTQSSFIYLYYLYITAPSVPAIKLMTRSLKLLDDGLIYTENIQDYLQENNDFLVVGIIGSQGVGKSTILNLLAHNTIDDKVKREIFKGNSNKEERDNLDGVKILTDKVEKLNVAEDEQEVKKLLFRQHSAENAEIDGNITFGIDFFITENRVMFFS